MILNEADLQLAIRGGRRLVATETAVGELKPGESFVVAGRNNFAKYAQVIKPDELKGHLGDFRQKILSELQLYAVPTDLLPVPGTIVIGDAAKVSRIVEAAATKQVTPGGIEATCHSSDALEEMWARDLAHERELLKSSGPVR